MSSVWNKNPQHTLKGCFKIFPLQKLSHFAKLCSVWMPQWSGEQGGERAGGSEGRTKAGLVGWWERADGKGEREEEKRMLEVWVRGEGLQQPHLGVRPCK